MVKKKDNRGGARKGAGRKRKDVEQKLVETLTAYDEVAMEALIDAVKDGESWAIKLFMEYRYGKPVARIEGNVDMDVLIDMSAWE